MRSQLNIPIHAYKTRDQCSLLQHLVLHAVNCRHVLNRIHSTFLTASCGSLGTGFLEPSLDLSHCSVV